MTDSKEDEMRTVVILLSGLLLVLTGCGKQDDSAAEKDQPSAAQAPGVIDLHTAAATGDLEAIRKHIDAGSDLNVRDPEGGACPLSTAALFGQAEAALTLIEAGADINCAGNDGGTPLHVAAFFCRAGIVKLLVDKGADRSIRNSYGSTPLEAVSGPWEEVKPVYEHFAKALEPMGIKLDMEMLEATRPKIAEMLK
jgi:hypothetical protein